MPNEWISHYRAPTKEIWTGRDDGCGKERYHQVIQLLNLAHPFECPKKRGIGFLGFACDEGVRRNLGNPGAKLGPQAIKKALAPLPCHNASDLDLFDCGEIVCDDGNLESAQKALAEAVKRLLEANIFPVVLGGGHEVAWGHFQGIIAHRPKTELGILNIDAHYDLRPLIEGHFGSSGTSFTQMAQFLEENHRPFHYACVGIQSGGNTPSLCKKAENLSVLTVTAEELYSLLPGTTHPGLTAFIHQVESIYLTICMDAFAAPYAPGVSARQPLGLTPWQVIPILNQLKQSGKLIAVDIAEVCPPRDENGITSQLAALLIDKLI